MATKIPPADDRPVFDAPLHVMRGADGTVAVFFPDGHRMVLTAEAAERSGSILWRTGVAQRVRKSRAPRTGPSSGKAQPSGKVIPVDFSGNSTPH